MDDIERPEPIKWRPWPLEHLRAYPKFVEFDPAWPWDPAAPDVAAYRSLLKFTSLRQMAREADRMCQAHTGEQPPCQVALFLYQFKDEGYEDCLYAHWALLADRKAGPEHCVAAITIEPLEFPEDGRDIQYWATWRLTRHPWDGPARQWAERTYRSSKVRWVNPDARQLLADYIARHHQAHADFLAQAPLNRHPLA